MNSLHCQNLLWLVESGQISERIYLSEYGRIF